MRHSCGSMNYDRVSERRERGCEREPQVSAIRQDDPSTTISLASHYGRLTNCYVAVRGSRARRRLPRDLVVKPIRRLRPLDQRRGVAFDATLARMRHGSGPVSLPIERIGGECYATPLVRAIEARKVDGDAVDMQISQTRQEFIPIFLAAPQRSQKQIAVLWQGLLHEGEQGRMWPYFEENPETIVPQRFNAIPETDRLSHVPPPVDGDLAQCRSEEGAP